MENFASNKQKFFVSFFNMMKLIAHRIRGLFA